MAFAAAAAETRFCMVVIADEDEIIGSFVGVVADVLAADDTRTVVAGSIRTRVEVAFSPFTD